MNCRHTDICNFCVATPVSPRSFLLSSATTRGLTTALPADSARLVISRIDYRIFVHGKNDHLLVEVA